MGQVQSGVISVDDFGDRVMGAVVAILSPRIDGSLTFKPLENISPQDKHVLPMLQSNQGNQYTTYYSEDKREAINNYITNHILDSEEHLNHFTNALISSLTGERDRAVVQQRAGVEPQGVKVERPISTHAPSIKSASTTRPPQSIAKASRRTEATQVSSATNVTSATQATQATQVTRATIATNATSATKVLAELENDTPSIRPVKGSNKLQKRIHTIDQAIDMERIAHQRMCEAQENIKASYRDSDVQSVHPTQSVHPSIQSNVKAVITEDNADEDNADEDNEGFEHVNTEPKDLEGSTDNE
jgi:hypothetical protein